MVSSDNELTEATKTSRVFFQPSSFFVGGMSENNQSVYELCGVDHHDHLVCVKCDTIIEFQDDVIEEHQLQIAKKYGFQLTDHSLYLYGLCGNCRSDS